MTDLVVLDIGGTHARFARATLDGARVAIGPVETLKTSDYASLQTAWAAYAERAAAPLPPRAAIAIAAPVTSDVVRMTNNSWVLETRALDRQLGLEQVTLLNDFGAVAQAVAGAAPEDFVHLCGPETDLPERGTISVIGPGTGLGVAHFRRDHTGTSVTATEGGHVDFAPVDAVDDRILADLRAQHRRVSTERVHSGPGIVPIYRALAATEHRDAPLADDRAIWEAGLGDSDMLASAAVNRFCQSLGSVAGDYALAHGAAGVAIAGGLGLRLKDRLPRSGFAERFRFKGRYEALMAALPVKLITLDQPGLIGAAHAFRQEHT